ncbi:phospholipase [Nocardiopsis chromatogenes]|uniref:phospholipase n=1 Tax=Nocardiopsis chromatogenes TaxID=280239 RepID=UPI00034AEBC2|nr:phospholipase [Nocardiopsis chromatogenes]
MAVPRAFTLRAVTAACAAAVTLPLAAAPAQADTLPPDELRRVTDAYVFDYALDDFIAVSEQRPHEPQLDWSNDGCSMSPDQPLGYDFNPGCVRHDFGYRNFKLQQRFDESNRLRIDNVFRDDLYGICDGDWVCRGVADIYYSAVRGFGGFASDLDDALERGDVEEKTERFLATAEKVEDSGTAEEAERLMAEFEQETGVDLDTEPVPVG